MIGELSPRQGPNAPPLIYLAVENPHLAAVWPEAVPEAKTPAHLLNGQKGRNPRLAPASVDTSKPPDYQEIILP